jgi:hypothetical protein
VSDLPCALLSLQSWPVSLLMGCESALMRYESAVN